MKEPEEVTCYKKSFDQSAAEKLKKTIANKESNEALAEKERASFRKHSSSSVFTRVLF